MSSGGNKSREGKKVSGAPSPLDKTKLLTSVKDLSYGSNIQTKGEISMMNISLTPELERFVNSRVKRGRYSSPMEIFTTIAWEAIFLLTVVTRLLLWK